MRRFIYALLLTVTLAACKNGGQTEEAKVMDVTLAPPQPSSESLNEVQAVDAMKVPPPAEGIAVEKKIIKEGSIAFETNDLKATRKLITDSLKKVGGYIGEESESNNSGTERKEYTLNVRIPAQSFERFLNTVSSSADRIESKNITVKDVTTEYIDVTTRLNNQKLLESRYKALLQKATKMADVLEVENKLNEIRTNIETTQGQLNYLNKQIAYSSLDITFFVETSVKGSDGNGFGYKFKSAFRDSWQILQSIFFGIITLWPVILLIGFTIWIIRVWWRRRKKRRAVISE